MKDINLISLVQAASSLNEDCFTRYYQHHGIGIKSDEVEVLKNFIKRLSYECVDKRIFNHFFVGYCIPQISKEFDLLRIGDDYIVNIELKRECTNEKIKEQLVKNRYYLKFLNEKIFNFTYDSSIDSLYLLTDDSLVFVEPLVLQKILKSQNVRKIKNINALFNPLNYLVSPFNSTDKFIADQYFLTNQQDNIKKQIIKQINTPSTGGFIAITGSAGTGKTLLIYDIASHLINHGKRVLLVHCGNLNEGHQYLNEVGWTIKPVKEIKHVEVNDYDVIVLDEVQRIWLYQFNEFVEKIKKSTCMCIFSYDELQVLDKVELENDIPSKIESLPQIVNYSLSKKIRTNKEVATFIRGFLNNKKNDPVLNCGNVSFEYYSNISTMQFFMHDLRSKGWEILQFTPNRYKKDAHEHYLDFANQNSHNVIGQEFDNVVVVVDEHFKYKDNGELDYFARSHYLADKMLFQNMTRTRNQLKILILNNPIILERCLTLLNPLQSQQTN